MFEKSGKCSTCLVVKVILTFSANKQRFCSFLGTCHFTHRLPLLPLTSQVQYINVANFMYIFSLLLVLCLFAFRNRKSHKVFKESKCAFFGSFFTAFTFLVIAVFNVLVDRTEYIITIQSTAILIALIVIWALFYGARMYQWFNKPEARNELTVTAEPSRTRDTMVITPPSNNGLGTTMSSEYAGETLDNGDTLRGSKPPVEHQTSLTSSQEIEMHAD